MAEPTDKQLLDFLQSLLDRKVYTGRALLRDSTSGRGWRLHETDLPGGVTSVREAIAAAMGEACRHGARSVIGRCGECFPLRDPATEPLCERDMLEDCEAPNGDKSKCPAAPCRMLPLNAPRDVTDNPAAVAVMDEDGCCRSCGRGLQACPACAPVENFRQPEVKP